MNAGDRLTDLKPDAQPASDSGDSDVLIMFTMDVEPAAPADGRTSGPATDAEGARRVREYAEILGAYGYAPTYFVHPEVAERQADLFLELQAGGAGLGLHLHTVKFTHGTTTYPCELGGLTRERQREAIRAAAELFEIGFSCAPRLFRPGCFSANDETYGVLCELGFTGGSISIPGRVWVDRQCVWAGAVPHPHRAHAALRQVVGDLPFVEIPLSVDRLGGCRTHALGFQYFVDLRPGGVYSEDEDSGRNHATILRNLVRQLADEKPLLKTLVVDVHNDRDLLSPDSTAARQFRTILDGLAPVMSEYGLRPVPATMGDAVQQFNQLQTS